MGLFGRTHKMNKENTLEIIKTAPSIYGEDFYFECDDGWFKLLLDLSLELSRFKYLKITQLKEKFGSLRVYFTNVDYEANSSKLIEQIISKYENISTDICEVCGNPGKLINNHGWYKTVCEEHNKKNLK